MTTELTTFSDALADALAAASPSIVQVQGAGRPASGLIFGSDVVLTMVRVLGRDDGLRVRREEGVALDAELIGWDPTTSLALLRVPGLGGSAIRLSSIAPRVGHLTLAIGRSWSNAVTASAGLVSVIGGPLRTSHRRAIDQVIRTTAPMHEGFAGGALLDPTGALLGAVTSTRIRGTTVVIPAPIASKTTEAILQHGRPRRGYLGIAGQKVRLPGGQQPEGRDTALLVAAVTPDSPAAAAGLLVGDVILALDGQPVESPEDLFDLLLGDRVGRNVQLDVARGGVTTRVPVTVGERPKQ
jgi:S1-C subfamily serine protease